MREHPKRSVSMETGCGHHSGFISSERKALRFLKHFFENAADPDVIPVYVPPGQTRTGKVKGPVHPICFVLIATL
jgi:hypothetical protein